MIDWRYQFPSNTLSRKHDPTQDAVLISKYEGEARKLLYELKNLMTFRKLGQLKMTRLFNDGTVIAAWSVFGQDFVNIDVSQTITMIEGIGVQAECVITLIDMPVEVQPMKNPRVIAVGEEQGIDYIKTYYSFEIKNCPECLEPEFQLDFRFPTTPVEPPGPGHNLLTVADYQGVEHYTGDPEDPADDDPENHCVISMDGGCSAEVIERGTDESGNYIIWKAYTESSQHTRSGLGWEKVVVDIVNQKDFQTLCQSEYLVKVDCCIKNTLQDPEIWWECWERADCSTFIMYGSTKLTKVPSNISMVTLRMYASAGGGYFYAMPSIGGCPEYQWSIAGYGRLIERGRLGISIRYQPEPEGVPDCVDETLITVTDRCGRLDRLHVDSCCQGAAPLQLQYTSLIMYCNQKQTFHAIGGCAPYRWFLSSSGGGGTLEVSGSGSEAIYTSPTTNPNCTFNPTIMLIDCCGVSQTIQLAVSCIGQEGLALQISDYMDCGCEDATVPGDGCYWHCWWNLGFTKCHKINLRNRKYYCDGSLWDECVCNCNYTWQCCDSSAWPYQPAPYMICSNSCPSLPTTCTTTQCGGHRAGECDILYDERTDEMKNLGCCPLNPLTGLPY